MKIMITAVMAMLGAGIIPSAWAEPEARRNIQEFIDAERQCPPFLQNLERVSFCEMRWWDPADGLGIWVDYAGLANDLLGKPLPTEISGSITERPMRDGRAEVTIRLLTKNALTFGIPFDTEGANTQFIDNPVYFGARPLEVADGAKASVGETSYMIRFINPEPGHPIPALIPLFSFPAEGQELLEIVFRAKGEGELRPAFGVPEGTRGHIQAAQTGIEMTNGGGATADSYPAEDVRIFRTGN